MMATNKGGGFATLTITLVLVSMLVAVSVFIGKVLVSDKRITLNEIEYRVALAAAEKGIADAMALLKVNPAATSVSGSLSTSAAAATYQVAITPDSPVESVWQLLSVATLSNGGGTTVSVQVAERSILNPANAGPAAPLVVAGNLPANGNITIVANPNGGGVGVPASVWSDGNVTLGGNAKTCSIGAFNSATCNSDFYSDGTANGLDIITNDINFPDDLVEYLFGVPDSTEGWAYLEKNATAVLTSCDAGNIKDGGFYVIKGVSSCTIGSNLGASDPVLIVLKDSSLTVNANTVVSGLLFAYDSAPGSLPDYTIKINGGAIFYGAMLANHNKIDLPTGNYSAVYDSNVLSRLMGGGSGAGAGNPFVNLNTIPGSWKDW